jgi:GAF domain-containing protein
MSVPLPARDRVVAALNNHYSKTVNAFDEEDQELAAGFAAYAAIAVHNSDLYEAARRAADQMREVMASRSVIEQAKGIVMARSKVSAAEAFAELCATPQRLNIKLRDIATSDR